MVDLSAIRWKPPRITMINNSITNKQQEVISAKGYAPKIVDCSCKRYYWSLYVGTSVKWLLLCFPVCGNPFPTVIDKSPILGS